MIFTIRLATEKDVRHFPEIEKSSGDCFRSIPELAWIADDTVMSVSAHLKHMDTGLILVAEDSKGHVDGFLTAEKVEDVLHIWQIGVRRKRQSMGVGTQMINACIEHAARRGEHALTLTTFRDVPWNGPFYARLGFVFIEPYELDERLKAVLAAEAAHGIPIDLRCAMRLEIAMATRVTDVRS